MVRSPMTWLFGIALVLAAFGPGAEAQGPGCRGRCAPAAVEGPRVPLDEAQVAAIAEALQDEYQGEAIYARVLLDHGDIRPFSNVVHAEQRHASFLEELLEARDLPVPANAGVGGPGLRVAPGGLHRGRRVRGRATSPSTTGFLTAGPLPDDVRQAFEHNRMASLEHHKPAFERCATGGGRGPRGLGVRGARPQPGPWVRRRQGCGGRCHRGANSGD